MNLLERKLGFRRVPPLAAYREGSFPPPIPGEGKTPDSRPCWTPGAAQLAEPDGKSSATGPHVAGPDVALSWQ
jgi:hypothetical protein